MDWGGWRRVWSDCTAVVFTENGTLSFRSGFYGMCAMRSANPPAEESCTRFLCVADYWSSYR